MRPPRKLSQHLHAVSPSCCPSWVQVAKDAYGAGIDVLISNAAVNPAAGPILEMSDGAIDKILEINIKSAVLLTREVAPHMLKVWVLAFRFIPSSMSTLGTSGLV